MTKLTLENYGRVEILEVIFGAYFSEILMESLYNFSREKKYKSA